MWRRILYLTALALVLATSTSTAYAQATQAPQSSCTDCHLELEGALGEPARLYPDDIHAARSLNCAACHGGNPAAEDYDKAHDPGQGFVGRPARTRIPQLCAQCHSNTSLMRSYNPRLRTDQLDQYWTSVHGQRLRRGDGNVAVCTDCHSVHDIRPASSPLSSVHPLRLPDTCGRCHADPDHMKGYQIPTDQLEGYQASVHFAALQGGDLGAPTCATCHGNHGAAPPGVESVERVCGTCHVFQEQLFDQSPHKQGFENLGLSSCETCHSNHEIKPTRDALIGTGEEAVCVICHSEGEPGWEAAGKIHEALAGLDSGIEAANEILDRAERAGMEISEARLTQANANERLVKARVDVHAFNPARVEETTSEGMELAQQAYQAGVEAMEELSFRRTGLALSLFAIAFVVFSLWLLIRDLERKRPPIQ